MTFCDIQIMTIVSMFQELSGKNSGKPFHDVKALTANGNPKELFFSSDLCAIVEHTKNYLAIEDNEIVRTLRYSVTPCSVIYYPVILSFSPS
jgi:glutamine---fructose-6-phosphate transaminase (isomerizing)